MTLMRSKKQKKSFLRPRSFKEAKIKYNYAKICKELDEQMLDDYGFIHCTSCGTNQGPFGHSHNLPKGQFKSLECDPENISLRCQDMGHRKGCHEMLDSCNFDKIKDFLDLDEIMQYRKEHNRGEYNKFVEGLKSVGINTYEYEEE